MKSLLAIAILVSALDGAPPRDPPSGNTHRAVSDTHFVREAAYSARVEVELGKLAQQKGKSPAVRKFGERMVAAHAKASDELATIASRLGIEPPKQVAGKHEGTLKRFQSMPDAAFDAAYARQVVAEHQNKIALFEQQSKKGQVAELKAFAEKTLATLREHLNMARDLTRSG